MAKAEIFLVDNENPVVVEIVGDVRNEFKKLLAQINQEVDLDKIEKVIIQKTYFDRGIIQKLVNELLK